MQLGNPKIEGVTEYGLRGTCDETEDATTICIRNRFKTFLCSRGTCAGSDDATDINRQSSPLRYELRMQLQTGEFQIKAEDATIKQNPLLIEDATLCYL